MDIEVLRELWETFEEIPPLFYNNSVSGKAVSKHMKDFLARSKRKPMQSQHAQSSQLFAHFQPIGSSYTLRC